ncbi:NAD(P)/FAD-dependent oxidoreductase [Fodinicola feengrottensis]|uniref:NAD(P)/FAD-dependent oxidoreductase n=1 Tax=Fodinicola feengrottensis TaxID=435914 RepID=UPI0024425CDE|nr:FAD-dependent oxidoreductase [Fodinicola feengrottensis]
MTENRPSIVVLGGGYAGIKVAKALDEVADVTLVDPTDAFVHNVAALRALVDPPWLDKIFLPYERLLKQGRFIQDRATAVEGRRVTLGSGAVLEPDYLVLATGSGYPFPAKSNEPDTTTAHAQFRDAHQALREAGRVLIIGAGPTGLELAGEIKAYFPDKHLTIADGANDILPGPFHQALRDELRDQVTALGIDLRLGVRLTELPAAPPATAAPIAVATEDGQKLTADIWFRAFGVTPRSDYLRGPLAEARDADGYLRVDEYLRLTDRVFAVGDISAADRNMASVAGHQATFLVAHLQALIAGEGDLPTYEPAPVGIAVPLGPDGGAGQFPGSPPTSSAPPSFPR